MKSGKTWEVGALTYTFGGLFMLFFWLLLGDFAISLRDRSLGPVGQLLLKQYGASNFFMSMLGVVPTILGMVISPVVSMKSDALRSRWGRRIPFILVSTPFAVLAMLGMAFSPQLGGLVHHWGRGLISHNAAVLGVFAVSSTLFAMANVVVGSVFGGLVNDVVPRALLGRFNSFWRAISLLDGMIFNWFILAHAEAHYTSILLWLTAVFGIGFTLMCVMVKEGQYPAPAAVGQDPRVQGFWASARLYCRDCFSKPYYLILFINGTVTGMAFGPINAWSLLYAKQVHLELGKWDDAGAGFGQWHLGYGGIITITYIFSLCLAYPIGALVDRWHALRVSIVTMFLYAVSCTVSYLLIHDARTFGWALLVHGVLSGSYFTGAAALGQLLLPRHKFSQFASAGGLIGSMVGLLFGPAVGKLLDWTGSDYHVTFLLSAVFSFVALATHIVLYKWFMALGGPAGYVAPGDQVAPASETLVK